MSLKRIEVAVGVLFRQQAGYGREVLVAQRLVKDRYFQKWEFPGGKLESGETPFSALCRELNEELAINVLKATPLIQLDHNYPDRHVRLHVFEINDFAGELQGKEGQAIQWLKPQQCAEIEFLQANEPIISAILLPKVILITDIQKYGLEKTMVNIENVQNEYGDIIVQLRENTNDLAKLMAYKNQIMPLLKNASLLLLNGKPEVAQQLNFDGVHLKSSRAMMIKNRIDIDLKWVGVSCHDDVELKQAAEIADFALLSPIQSTQSHPEQQAKGWEFFSSCAEKSSLPVYALGGMSLQQCEKARLNQGQGVAVLRAAWQ